MIRGSSPSGPQRAPHVARSEAEREREHDQPEEDGITSNDPYERQYAERRYDDENQTKNHRECAVQDQKPLTMGTMKVNRRHDLQHARHNRPGADHQRQNHRRRTGKDERDDTGRDPSYAPQQERPEALMMLRRLHAGDDGEHPIDERIHSKERDEKRDSHPRDDKRGYPEEHR